jgi:LPPG:FO 2-phospho-L-lactate transferase
VVAVSPIIGGRAIKGPADRMLLTLAGEASARAVAAHYADVLSHILVDTADASLVPDIEALGVRTRTAETIMRDADGRAALAREALKLVDMLGE